MSDEFYSAKTTIDQRIADCITKRDILNERIERLKQVKAVWDDLPFKEGAVAFHKEFGNVLIKSIEYGSKEDTLEDIKYNIITCNRGTQKVSFRDVIEISKATEVLYGRENVR